jgi:endoglucanase
MKKITLLLSLILSSLGFSQIVTNGDFQNGSVAPWTGNAANVVDLGGMNYVNQANVTQAGEPYFVNLSQNIALTNGLTYQLKFDAFTDTTTGSRTMVVGLGQNNAPYIALTSTPTLTATSQTFTYQYTINYGEAVADRVIFDMGAAVGFVFIDNVSVIEVVNTCGNGIQDGTETGVDCGGTCPPCILPPTVAAPTPPARPAADVKSIFSDAYAPIAVLNYLGVDNTPSNDNTFNTSWCPAVTSLVQVATNNTNKVTGLGCEGIAFLAGRFDATAFTFFHMDIWTNTPTMDKSFNFKFSNWNGGAGEANAIGYSATNANLLPATNPGTWISLDIPLSSFTAIGGAGRNDLAQFVITSDLGTVFYDNIYLHKNTLATTSFENSNVKMYPNPATSIFTIESKDAIEKVSVYNFIGQEVITKSTNNQSVALDVTNLQVGVYVVKATINGVISTSKIVKE